MKTNKMSDNRISRVLKRAVSLALMLSLAAGILIFTPEKAEAAASQFDMNFGTAGKVVTDFGGFDSLRDIVIQADGKIVAVGGTDVGSDFAVARYNIDGTLDTGFDGDGKVTTDFGVNVSVRAGAIQPDGRIVVLGVCSNSFCLARYNSNGSLDTAFDGDGKVITDLPDSQIGNDIVIQPDGKIVVAGSSSAGLNSDFIVARYNPNGTLDTTFNTNGYVITSILGNDPANAVALQSDGKIIAVGQSNADFALVRYNSNGSLDTSFDTDGIVTTNIAGTDIADDVIIQPDGKIIAAGDSQGDFALARYNADGSLDSTFDSDGKVVVDFGDFDDCRSAALQPNGKIVAVGNVQNSGMAVARFNPNGSLDTSFHGDGKLITVITSSADIAQGVAIQNDGKIVIGGAPSFGAVNFALTRFLGDPQKSFTNFNGIFPADRTSNTNPPGLPSNYPSIADINGATGTITKVRVTLTNVTHTFPADFDVLLVGPQGQRTILMSDAGGGTPGVTGRTYIFDQSAATDFPSNTAAPSGIYKPFNFIGNASIEPGGIDVFPAPGPGSANYGAANLDVFNGTNPNGIWNLYVVDDETGDTGFLSTFTLEVTTTTSRLNNLGADFDGDGRTDISIFRPAPGEWWYLRSFDGANRAFQFGQNTDQLVPADFTGDGKTDIAFFRPSNGEWFILRSEDSSFFSFPFGATGDIPVPADFDGDGRADPAVFRPSNQTWYIQQSTDGTLILQFGAAGDKPVVADYDGDGKADLAIFRPSVGEWWYLRSSDGANRAFQFGNASDKPVPGDFTGDGRADIAFWRASDGFWYILRSEDESFYSFPFGLNGDIPAPGDFDGDGKFDPTVFRPSTATWYSNRSTAGQLAVGFGISTDRPVPGAFIP